MYMRNWLNHLDLWFIYDFVYSRMFCAGDFDNDEKDVCEGDDGGPLIDPTTKEQVGILSFGFGCKEGIHKVYSSIANPQSRGCIRAMTGLPL